ncbi:tRNA(His) guanylyltransferase 2, partial [Mucuna pruriens]
NWVNSSNKRNYNILLPSIVIACNRIYSTLIVEDNLNYTDNGAPFKRHMWKIATMHSEKINSKCKILERADCWFFLRSFGDFVEEISNVNPEYVRSFEFDSKLMQYRGIVVRLDGCHFHIFSEIQFVKPNSW